MSQTSAPPISKARYIMIGGFLGAGKTTAVARLARHLVDRGTRVGLITNDQAGGLVDTRLLRHQGYATEEIAGGCFCCRFNTLVEAARKLVDQTKPDCFIAEPVGSCTDLVATVTYPLRRMYGDSFRIAPLSVLLDSVRALRVFGLQPGGSFSPKVLYIYKKQIEEADLILLNKSDLVSPADLAKLRDVLARNFPRSRILTTSTRDGSGLDEWFEHLLSGEQSERAQTMTLDYDVYADGEANLGWLNATVVLGAADEFDASAFLQRLASAIQAALRDAGAEVAHLKMTLSPANAFAGGLASVQLVRNDHIPELGLELDGPITGGELVVNLRAEAPPAMLLESLQQSLEECRHAFPSMQAALEHEEHFRPGRPEPTYRDGGTAADTCSGDNCGCRPPTANPP